MTAPLLVGLALRKEYGGRAVVDVDRIELHEGELLALLGPNGAGKSTLLRMLAMLEPPSAGMVRFRDRSGRDAARRLRRASAAVLQRPHLWRDSVAYNVGLGLRLRGVSVVETNERVARICQLLGIEGLLSTDVSTLSGGEAQRVALARALVLGPDVLFLDEPTANLDTAARTGLREDLERVARQRATSILLVTHDRHEAFLLADRIVVLVAGRVVQTGTPMELYENPVDPYIARLTGAELTLRGRVVRAHGRTLQIDVEGGRLVAVGDAGEGARVKIAYRPEDLILGQPELAVGELSTRNLLFATVSERRDLGGLVRLRLAGPPELVAVVTRSAAEQLRLAPGARVSVRIKATALHAYAAARESSAGEEIGRGGSPIARPPDPVGPSETPADGPEAARADGAERRESPAAPAAATDPPG